MMNVLPYPIIVMEFTFSSILKVINIFSQSAYFDTKAT